MDPHPFNYSYLNMKNNFTLKASLRGSIKYSTICSILIHPIVLMANALRRGFALSLESWLEI